MKQLTNTVAGSLLCLLALNCSQQRPASDASESSQTSAPTPAAETAAADTPPAEPFAEASTTTDTTTPAPATTAPATQTAPAAAPAASAEALTDEQIASVTSLANNSEIEQAKLARARSKNEQVLQFAGMMIAHHGEAQRKQDALSVGSAESPLSRDMLVESSETMRLLKEKQGAEFDRAYMQAQVQAHQKVLDAIDKKLLPSAKRADLKAHLEILRPRIKQHLEQAERTVSALASREQPSAAVIQ
jgi:putative membrane protein